MGKTAYPLAALAAELKAEAEAKAIVRLKEWAGTLQPAEAVTARAAELARAAADRLQAVLDLKPFRPMKLRPPAAQTIGAGLPWNVRFDQPLNLQQYPTDRRCWQVSGNATVTDGQLVLRDPDGSIGYSDFIEFATGPVEIEYRFINKAIAASPKGEWFHGAFVRLQAETPDPGDYLNVRVNYGRQIRLENGETPPSNYQKALFDYQPIEPNVWHTATLRLDVCTYRLSVDGKVLDEGLHRVSFTRGKLGLSMYTAPVSQGNAFIVDYLTVRRARQ